MTVTVPVKKSTQMIKWMAQAAPLKEASTVKKMNDQKWRKMPKNA